MREKAATGPQGEQDLEFQKYLSQLLLQIEE
jgi:hypothetical protein